MDNAKTKLVLITHNNYGEIFDPIEVDYFGKRTNVREN